MMVEMTENINNLEYSPVLVTLRNNTTLERFSVPITYGLMHNSRPITIQAGKVLFNLEPITDITSARDIQCQMNTCTKEEKVTNEVEENIKKLSAMSKLEDEQKKEFEKLLAQYPNLFAHKDTDVGHTSVVKHKIPLKDETPFKDRVQRIPLGMYEEVKKKIEEILKAKVIWPSHSAWNSNIVLALKKDST